jgi:predicted  nucleic acid-binding Zn-ribbon protein
MADQGVKCGDCGAILADGPEQVGASCPACGSSRRAYYVGVGETVEVHERLSAKAKDPGRTGKQKVRTESVSGDDLHRATGRWNKLDRSIDRENDRYRERIVDPQTGAVIRSVDEPLSKHQGHGSAKKGK